MSLFARLTLILSLLAFTHIAVSAQTNQIYKMPGTRPADLGRQAPANSTSLTNDSIISFVQAEISDDVIVRKIRAAECQFNISPQALAELKDHGVSKLVLQEMINASTPPPAIADSERMSSPRGAKFYIAPMPEGFDGFIAAEMVKRKLPLTIVTDEHAADFIITGGTSKGVHKWYDTVFGSGYERDRNQGSIRVVRVKDRTVAWAGEAGDRSLWWGAWKKGGQRKVADRVVGKMNSQFIKKAL